MTNARTIEARSGIALVTGVSGFVGSAVARALAGAGWSVRGMARASSRGDNLDSFPGTLVEGDLRDAAAVERAVSGVDYVFHVAADYRIWAPDPGEIVRNNLATTRGVMQAALAAGVQRIVYTSSVATILPDPLGPADERRPATDTDVVGAYKRSKVVAERLVEKMVREQGLPAVIVNPSTPIGPRDVRPTPTGRIIVEAANGRMPAFVDSGLNLVHVDDVASGHVAALERGRIGERYILGGQDVSLAEMLRDIAARMGRKPPTVALPRAPLFPPRLGQRKACEGDRQGAVPDARRATNGEASHVLFVGQGAGRSGLALRAITALRSRMRSPGSRARG